jgi:hypothetical protein
MTTRIVIVTLLSIFAIAVWAPDAMRPFGHPLGSSAFAPGYGREIDWVKTPLASRVILAADSLGKRHPAQRFPVRVRTPRGGYTALAASAPEPAAERASVLPRDLFQLILMAAGIALVLLRPGRASWGFFIFTLFVPLAPANASIWFGPPALQLAMLVLVAYVLPAAAYVGGLVFALYLFVEPPYAQWRVVSEATAYAGGVAVVMLGTYAAISQASDGTSPGGAGTAILALQVAGALAMPAFLLATYAMSEPSSRERLRWVIFGVSVNAAILIAFTLALPSWLYAVLAAVQATLLGFTVLYAVLKVHVADFNLALSRTCAYAVLCAVAAGVFALVEMFFTNALSARNAGLMADIGLALLFGLFFAAMRSRIDRFAGRALFRRKRVAQEHLRTVIRAMPFVASRDHLDRLIVEEPVRSFALSGATLFACREDGTLQLRHEFGPSPPQFAVESRRDALGVFLQGEQRPLRLNKHGWDSAAVAVPVFSHGQLTAVALYGLHANGTDLDGEEIAYFVDLANTAGNTYDRLDARGLREQVRNLNEEVTELRTRRFSAHS